MSDLTESTGAAPFDDAAAEALLLGHGDPNDPLAAALTALRGAADCTPPRPSPELAALLGGRTLIDELSRRRRAGRVVLGAFVVGGTTLGLSGVAAAHDALPGPAQGVVTDIVNTLTPFDITHRPAAVVPSGPSPTDTEQHRRHDAAEPTSSTSATSGGEDGSRDGGPGPGRHDGDTNDGIDHDGGAGGGTRDRDDDGATAGRDADDGDDTHTTDATATPDEDANPDGGGGDNGGSGGGGGG